MNVIRNRHYPSPEDLIVVDEHGVVCDYSRKNPTTKIDEPQIPNFYSAIRVYVVNLFSKFREKGLPSRIDDDVSEW